MSEFSGWFDMAIKMWLAIIAFLVLLALAFVASYRFFGWKGPVGIMAIWLIASFIYDTMDRLRSKRFR